MPSDSGWLRSTASSAPFARLALPHPRRQHAHDRQANQSSRPESGTGLPLPAWYGILGRTRAIITLRLRTRCDPKKRAGAGSKSRVETSRGNTEALSGRVVSTREELVPFVRDMMTLVRGHQVPSALESVELSEEFGSVTASNIYETLEFFSIVYGRSPEPQVPRQEQQQQHQQQQQQQMVQHQQQQISLDALPGTKWSKRFVLVYLGEIQNYVCDVKESSAVSSVSGVSAPVLLSTLAAWITHTLGVSEPLAIGIANAILLVIISAGRDTFCKLTKSTFSVSLDKH